MEKELSINFEEENDGFQDKITRAFMNVLMNTNLKEDSIKAVVQLLWNDVKRMDEMVSFIKNNSNATETELLNKAVEITREETKVFPAVFHKEEKEENGYRVEFPDIPGCITTGETLKEAFLMAGDALNCWFSNEDEICPESTPISEIKVEPGEYVMLVRPALYISEGAKQYLLEEAEEKKLERMKK